MDFIYRKKIEKNRLKSINQYNSSSNDIKRILGLYKQNRMNDKSKDENFDKNISKNDDIVANIVLYKEANQLPHIINCRRRYIQRHKVLLLALKHRQSQVHKKYSSLAINYALYGKKYIKKRLDNLADDLLMKKQLANSKLSSSTSLTSNNSSTLSNTRRHGDNIARSDADFD